MKIRPQHVVIGIGLISLMTFLFIKTNLIESDAHNRFSQHLRHLKALDATLDKDILESRYGLQTNYDLLITETGKINDLQKELKTVPGFLGPDAQERINNLLYEFSDLQGQKELLIERFKSRNAIINNSLRYFPLATSNLIKNTPANSSGQKEIETLNYLQRDVLGYYLLSDADLEHSITDRIALLEQRQKERSPTVDKKALDITISHARTILNLKPEVDDLVKQIVSLPTANKVEQLIALYDSYFDESLRRANIYRLFLYILSVVLLAYIVFIIVRLKKATSALEQDIVERKRTLAEREVISEIIQGVASTANLDELLQLIYRSIGKVIYAENCFVALYNPKTEMLDMQFWVDKYDPAPPPFKMGRGFAAYICRTERAMIMTPKIIDQLLKQGEIEFQGTAPAIWLGVPLRTSAGIIGVLAVQHYEDEKAYSLRDLELLITVGDQIALTIERKRVEEALRISEEQHRLLFETNPQPVFVYDLETLDFLAVNEATIRQYGYSKEEFLTAITVKDIHPTNNIPVFLERVSKVTSDSDSVSAPSTHQDKNGTVIDVEITSHALVFAGRRAEIVLVDDVTERRRLEGESKVISEIIQGVASTANLDELLQLIHRSIGKILYAENCYVALYDAKTDLLSVVFCVDKYDEPAAPAKLGTGLTAYVLRKNLPMLMTTEVIHELSEKGDIAIIGTDPAIWLGVPLRTPEGIIGVLVVQHYEDPDAYDPRDVRFLSSVGDQIAIAIERKRVEEALQISEEQHRLMFESNPQPAFVFDIETLAFLAVNEAAIRHYGYSREEVLSTITAKDLRISEDAPDSLDRLARARSGVDIILEPSKHRTKDGTVIDVEVTLHAVIFAGRNAELLLVNDVTKRKKAEEETGRLNVEIESQRRRLNTIIANVQGVVWETKIKTPKDGIALAFDFVSDYFETMVGYGVEECLNNPDFWLDIVHPDDRERTEREIQAIYAGGKGGTLEFRWIAKDGREVWVESRNMIICDNAGNTVGLRGVAVDITERKQVEEALQESEERYRNLIENAMDIIYTHDLKGNFTSINRAGEKITGYTKKEALGMNIGNTIAPEFVDKAHQMIAEKLAGNEVTAYELETIAKDGHRVAVEVNSRIIYENGLPVGVQGIARDITERKRVENTLRENEEKYRELFENANDIIYSLDLSGNFTSLNRAGERITGYSRREARLMNIADVVAPKDATRVRERIARNIKSSVSPNFELEIIAKDECKVTLDISSRLILQNGVPVGIQGIGRDITERKQAEARPRESEEWMRTILEGSRDGIIIEGDGSVVYANKSYSQLFGYAKPEDLIGKPTSSFLPPEEEERMAEYGRRRLLGKEVPSIYEFTGKSKNGTLIGLEGAVSIAAVSGKRYIMTAIRDTTERVKTRHELERFNEKLQQSNRELQDFAYVASHDLQEPLRKVQAFSDRLKTKYADKLEGDGLDYLERMRSAANRMQLLIQDLLTFSRVSTKAQDFIPVDLDTLTREVLLDLEVKIEETGATVEFENLPTIDADPMQMRQLMQNLVGNALKFRHKDTAPYISIRTREVESNGNGSGGNLQISVQDNGIGFDEKYTDKIFAVFQRLHGRKDYDGSGVGLAICRKIVERHSGSIIAQSKPGDGSTFIVTLPFKQRKVEAN